MLASMVIAPAMVAATDQDVAVPYVPQFVGQHAFQFFVVEQPKDPMSHGYRGVLRVASRGEGVGRLGRDHIDLRHRQANLLGQPLHNLVGARQLLARHRLRLVHGQCDLVGVKIGDEVHHGGKSQRQQHPILPAKVAAKEHQQQRKRGQQEGGLECISHRLSDLSLLDVTRRGEMQFGSFRENCG